jgi:lambda repressor-like predicted transcriptional regulator
MTITSKMLQSRIFAMRRQGYTLKEISQAVGTSMNAVRLTLLASGKFPVRVPLRGAFAQEIERAVLALRKRGYSLRRIGATVGYSYETVIIRDRGAHK